MNKADEIRVYRSNDGPSSSRWRWTRRSSANHKIVAASSEGYARKATALANIKRTQLKPYTIVVDSLR